VELGTSTAVEALRGPENTVVALTIKATDGATAIIPVTRKKVQIR
jgi:VCBS repeat-containing protein